MKAYFWKQSEDEENGIAIVADNWKEARKLGAEYWATDAGLEYDYFITQRCHLIKDANVEGLPKGAVDDWNEGLRRGMYSYVEYEQCEICGQENTLWLVDGKCICTSCEADLEKKE